MKDSLTMMHQSVEHGTSGHFPHPTHTHIIMTQYIIIYKSKQHKTTYKYIQWSSSQASKVHPHPHTSNIHPHIIITKYIPTHTHTQAKSMCFHTQSQKGHFSPDRGVARASNNYFIIILQTEHRASVTLQYTSTL